jgi:hypothetical protein
MTLSLLHPLLAGLALSAVAIPIVIHLLLRQQPKTVIFPALVLLKPRQVQTIRRLKLRHWLLLFLRAALLAVLGLALARPTLRSSMLSIDQEAPLAAVMIVDDSPSMGLIERGDTRLTRAKSLAEEASQRLPEGSQIAVFTSSDNGGRSLAPISVARQQLDRLEPSNEQGSLADALTAGLQTLIESTLPRREVYIFTDGYRHAWNISGDSRLTLLWEKVGSDINVFVINVRAEQAQNVSIESARPAGGSVAPQAEIAIDVQLRSSGEETDNIVRLSMDGEARSEKPVRVPAGQGIKVPFQISGLAEGFHQGDVRLATSDGLAIDDVRYFSIDVRSSPRVLIVSDTPSDAIYFRKAIEPVSPSPEGSRSLTEIRTRDWEKTDLSSVDVVALLNVGQLDQKGWSKLIEFIARGGGVFVAVGASALTDSYNATMPQEILPARLDSIHERPPTRLSIGEKPHPLMDRFREWGESDFADGVILRYWKTVPMPAAVVVLRYADGQPALIERASSSERAGRLLLLTTPTHYQANEIWNELPLSWSFVVLVEEMIKYLAGTGETRLDYLAGENVEIPRRRGDPWTLYAVKDPAGPVERLAVDHRDTSVVIPRVRTIGQYTVTASSPNRPLATGFSVNVSPNESLLEPISDDEMLATLPTGRASVVRDATDLQRAEGTSRIGRELFPWLMLIVICLLTAESYFSNWFYRRKESIPSVPNPLLSSSTKRS